MKFILLLTLALLATIVASDYSDGDDRNRPTPNLTNDRSSTLDDIDYDINDSTFIPNDYMDNDNKHLKNVRKKPKNVKDFPTVQPTVQRTVQPTGASTGMLIMIVTVVLCILLAIVIVFFSKCTRKEGTGEEAITVVVDDLSNMCVQV